ncbi:MAG: S-layer homology domain-containing protein [Oscillospiraceae bacterium]|nr:S-layer homology domain-containing protein [Oscillospiraceae bacterium]
MKTTKAKLKIGTLFLALLLFALTALPAAAKTTPAGETVGTVLFYITGSGGEEILVSQIPVAEMEADMKAGKLDETVHNYSLLDRFVTTLHQEAQGFTVPAFVDYARGKSSVEALRSVDMTFAGDDVVRFWEIDQTGFDDMDTYSYDDLYGVKRYNFPRLYEYWDYAKQDYYDPAGKMTRDEVIDHIFAGGEEEIFLLSVRAFSQRYMVTSEKFGVDYNMESYWFNQGLLDNQRTIRVMKPMTRDELFNKTPTASDTRYWTANILLDMERDTDIKPLGSVAAPTAVMTDAGDNYYIRFSCATPGATILYNHNFISPSYTPTSPYGDGAVVVPKDSFKTGEVTMTARAVKDGYTDEGVVTLKLKSSGTEQNPVSGNAFSDVPEGEWYEAAVDYVMDRKLFDTQGATKFAPDDNMTRAMLAVAIYRAEGSPDISNFIDFADITRGTPLSAAVSWCSSAKIVLGDENGAFNPDSPITREMIAVFFYRWSAYKKEDLSAKGDLSIFPDSGEIHSWALKELEWANGAKLVNGADGKLNPGGEATRAQAAQLLMNYGK